jgi:hypothetical protein
MKAFLVFCLTVCMIGCTTLRPVANVPGDLSQHFNDGGVLKPGDRVDITTTAGAKRHFRVSSVHDGVVYGDHDSVPFSEIASVERRESSPGKTSILVIVAVALAVVIASGLHEAEHPNVGPL